MGKIQKYGKLIILDLLGITLITAGVAFGWLPGPGGIPLFLAGLALLSVHHDWAKRWFDYIKKNGLKITDKIFVNNPRIKMFYDLVSGLAVICGLVLITSTNTRTIQALAIFLLFAGSGLFLGNRGRLDWLLGKTRSNKHKN